MTLAKWDPVRNLVSLQERMNRLFEDSMKSPEDPMDRGAWSPPVDIYETEKDIVVSAELPGIDQKDVDVEVREGVLTIKGERRFMKDVKEESYHRVERSYGRFSRVFALPKNVETEKVSAHYDKGVLEVRLPKSAKSQAHTVKIETNEK